MGKMETGNELTKLNNAYAMLVNECNTLLLRAEKEAILSYWKLGELANKMRGKDRAKYGDKTIQNLSNDLNISRSFLYHALNFNTQFTERELSNALDNGLKWKHIIHLLSVKDQDKRSLLVEKTGTEKLSARELKNEILSLKPPEINTKKSQKLGDFGLILRHILKIDSLLSEELNQDFKSRIDDSSQKQMLEILEILQTKIAEAIKVLK